MKFLVLPFLFFCALLDVSAQKIPALLKGGEKPSFSYMECLHNLPNKKDRYCNQYNYTLYIKDQKLYIIESKINEVDRPKKAYTRDSEYSINIDEIDINKSLDKLDVLKETYSIKDMEGNKDAFYKFTLYSTSSEGIRTMEYGKEVGYEKLELSCDSHSDAKEFLQYLLVGGYK